MLHQVASTRERVCVCPYVCVCVGGWGGRHLLWGAVYTTVLLVPMAFLLRMLMAYSLRLVPFSSLRSGFLRTDIFTE